MPPRPKPPRRVKDEAETKRRILSYKHQRIAYDVVLQARKLAFVQRN